MTAELPPDRVRVEGLRVLGRHGVLPEEQSRLQPFVVDVTLVVDLSVAAGSDDLADTVDYAAAAARVAEVVSSERWALLERLAGRICEELLADPRVLEVGVRVAKPNAPLGLDAATVAVELTRRRP